MMLQLAERFRQQRLAMSFTQEGLANRSGVSFGSVKRFERLGQISLESLLKLALVLDLLKDFEAIGQNRSNTAGLSLDEVLADNKNKKRGLRK